jgi:hypothetical protein
MDKNIKIIIFFILFLGGLYFYVNYNNTKEGLTTLNGENRCPNLLIQKGVKFFLYNSNIAEVPGVNPIEFNNLEEYIEFLEWQRGAGIICPVLYLQNTYDAQGNRVYKVRPSVTEQQGGLPPVVPVPLPTKFINVNNDPVYPGNLEFNQAPYFTQTVIPSSNNSENKITNNNNNLLYSPDAMDPNWGGADYTEALVNKGYYSGDNVQIFIP